MAMMPRGIEVRFLIDIVREIVFAQPDKTIRTFPLEKSAASPQNRGAVKVKTTPPNVNRLFNVAQAEIFVGCAFPRNKYERTRILMLSSLLKMAASAMETVSSPVRKKNGASTE
jgi:hypothetical protein